MKLNLARWLGVDFRILEMVVQQVRGRVRRVAMPAQDFMDRDNYEDA